MSRLILLLLLASGSCRSRGDGGHAAAEGADGTVPMARQITRPGAGRPSVRGSDAAVRENGSVAPAGLEAAMAGFAKQVVSKSQEGVVDFFPARGVWTLVFQTGGKETSRKSYRRQATRTALKTGGDLEFHFFEDDSDTLMGFALLDGDWVYGGDLTFVPPGHGPGIGPPLWVRWRREGARWVIDQIFAASS
jgi:hypothetical protein